MPSKHCNIWGNRPRGVRGRFLVSDSSGAGGSSAQIGRDPSDAVSQGQWTRSEALRHALMATMMVSEPAVSLNGPICLLPAPPACVQLSPTVLTVPTQMHCKCAQSLALHADGHNRGSCAMEHVFNYPRQYLWCQHKVTVNTNDAWPQQGFLYHAACVQPSLTVP